MAKSNQVIQMYATAAGDAAASIDVPDDGMLLGGVWSGICKDFILDEAYMRLQLSFGSTGAFTTNDARQSINQIMWGAELVGAASAGLRTEVNQSFDLGEGVAVFAGERIYIHTLANGGAVLLRATCSLLFNFKAGSLTRR